MNLRDQDCEGNHKTVEEESDHVSYDFANKEEAVYNVHFLPESNFLQKCLNIRTCREKETLTLYIVPYRTHRIK